MIAVTQHSSLGAEGLGLLESRSIVDKINKDVSSLFKRLGFNDDPANLYQVLNRVSHGGHFPIGPLRCDIPSPGEILHTTTGNILDGTRRWLTQVLKIDEHEELNNEEFDRLLLWEAKCDHNSPELSNKIEGAFHEMLLKFWPEANKIMLKSAGTLAVDDACAMACRQVADETGKEAQKMKGFGFVNGFHGRHGWGADLTDSPKVSHKKTGKALPPVVAPILEFDSKGNADARKASLLLEESMKQAEKYLSRDDVAFVIVEYPFQAEGGARVLHLKTMKRLSELCKKYGKILIADCVQMGGRSWHQNKEGVATPFAEEVMEYADIITFGKIFRVNGLMAKDFTKRGFKQNAYDAHPGEYGGTYTGRYSEMLMGYTIMQTILDNELWKNALNMNGVALKKLVEISQRFPGLITSIKWDPTTAYLGWDFASPKISQLFQQVMLQEFQTLTLPAREKAIRWVPLADNTEGEIDLFFNNMTGALPIVAAQLTVT
jgi:acetylornithine/succinyldiaminopimelate/putrescine aminotransferase